MSAQTAIVSAIQTILGASYDVAWGQVAQGWTQPANVRLRVLSRQAHGVDEVRYFPEGPNDLREKIVGQRTLRVQVTCETLDQDLVDSAHETADVLVAGFQRSDVEAILAADSLGVPRTTTPIDVDYQDEHGDWRSAVVFEAWFPASRTHVGPLVPIVHKVEFRGDMETGTDIGPETVDDAVPPVPSSST